VTPSSSFFPSFLPSFFFFLPYSYRILPFPFLLTDTERKSGRLEVVTLDLLSNDATKVLLKNRLGEVTPEDLSVAADKLGGHLPDILTFTNKIRSGLVPKGTPPLLFFFFFLLLLCSCSGSCSSCYSSLFPSSNSDSLFLLLFLSSFFVLIAALSQMIQEAIVIIRSEGFGIKGTADVKEKSTAKLVRAPLWETIRIIASQGSVSYDHLLFTVFQGDEKALNSLVKANILRIVHKPDTGKSLFPSPYSSLSLSLSLSHPLHIHHSCLFRLPSSLLTPRYSLFFCLSLQARWTEWFQQLHSTFMLLRRWFPILS
jgi:hypothetical protein